MKECRPIRNDPIGKPCREFFGRRVAGTSRGEKSTLHHMSRMPEAGTRFSSIASATRRGKGAVSPRLNRLEKWGIVYRRSRGLYAFVLPMLGQHLSHATGAGIPRPARPCSMPAFVDGRAGRQAGTAKRAVPDRGIGDNPARHPRSKALGECDRAGARLLALGREA